MSRSTKEVPPIPAEKANAESDEQLAGRALDTIVDGEGNILEPPE